MEMGSREHRYGARCLAKAVFRRMQERAMKQPLKPSLSTRKRPTTVEVQILFEPSRLAQQCLADAYACLMPPVRRRLRQAQATTKPAQTSAERKAQ